VGRAVDSKLYDSMGLAGACLEVVAAADTAADTAAAAAAAARMHKDGRGLESDRGEEGRRWGGGVMLLLRLEVGLVVIFGGHGPDGRSGGLR